jgi:tetratricopeptide (TPR) repeat protein
LRDVLARADEAVAFFDAHGDEEGQALAIHWASSLRFWLGDAGVALDGFDRALAYAQGRPAMISMILTFEAAARIWGPSSANEIEEWATDVSSICGGAPIAEAAVLMARAYARALAGDATGARKHANRARSIHGDMGLLAHLARTESVLGLIELLVDDLPAAERGLRRAYDVLNEGRETGFLSTVASILAEVLCERGNDADAASTARHAIDLSSPDDVDPHARSTGVLAVVAARAGDLDAAVELARGAVDVCRDTDLLMIQADALRRLGEVLKAAGRDDESARAFTDALDAYERKGNVVMAGKIRRVLDIGGVPPSVTAT